MRIAILDDYHGVATHYADWSVLGPQASLTVFREPLPEGAARAAALEPFDVIVAMRERTPFPAELVYALPNLRLLVTTGIRNYAIDMAACAVCGVRVSTAPGHALAVEATSELSWAMILALFKRLPQENANMHEGLWQTGMPTVLAGRRLGVVGLGRMGTAVARMGLAFNMDVVAWSPNLIEERAAQAGVKRVGKEELFATSDVVSVHMPLSERSWHIVDAAALGAMQSTAFLVNTSRAGLVDEAALMTALCQGRLAGAGLDVYGVEPLPADAPIRSLPNVVLTPHLGYVSQINFESFYRNAVEAIAAWVAGVPIRVLS